MFPSTLGVLSECMSESVSEKWEDSWEEEGDKKGQRNDFFKRLATKPFNLFFFKTQYLSKKKMYLEKSTQTWNHAMQTSLLVQILLIQIMWAKFQRLKIPALPCSPVVLKSLHRNLREPHCTPHYLDKRTPFNFHNFKGEGK